MTEPTHFERPNTIPWPPILLVGLAAASLLLTAQWPAPIAGTGVPAVTLWIGLAIALVGLSFDTWAIAIMHRRQTNVWPTRAADKLLTTGPFALSRNPIYLGNTLLLLGAGIAFNSLWILAAAIANAVLVHHLAIRREEAHLAARFPDEWDAYKRRVPRWIGPL